MRPDYCPIGGEPCQSVCATPCSVTKRTKLTDAEIERIADSVPIDEIGVQESTWHIRLARAIEKAHGIGGGRIVKKKLHSGASLLAAMHCPQHLSFDDAMAALRRMGEASDNTLWPTLSGNEIMAFANAAIDEYLQVIGRDA